MAKQLNPQWLVDRFPKDLKGQIRYLVTKDFQVINQSGDSAQLVKTKKFSCLFCLITGFIPYLIWYMAKRDQTIFLDLSDQSPKPMAQQSSFKSKVSEFYDAYGVGGVVGVIFALLVLFSIGSSLSKPADKVTTDAPAVTGSTTSTAPATAEAPKEKTYQEIFAVKGKGNTNSEAFQATGGNLKMVVRTSGSTVGSFTGFRLESENGTYLSNASINVSTEGAEAGTGQTIIRGAKAGKYFVSVISGISWEVSVSEEK